MSDHNSGTPWPNHLKVHGNDLAWFEYFQLSSVDSYRDSLELQEKLGSQAS